MDGLSDALRQQWRNSISFQLWTTLAIAGLVINLALTVLWQMGVIGFEDSPPVNDLKIYLEAGDRFLQREDLYIAPRPDFGLYGYAPAFAMVISVLTFVPYKLVWVVDALLHIIVYWAIYWRWFVIFREQRLNSAAETLVRLFPLWIIFTGLLYEIAYMNIYIFMVFIATLLIEAMLHQQTGKGILWLAVLLPIKPQWAFALGIPFLFGEWRFLAKVMLGAILAYTAIFAITVPIAGPYALQQSQKYFQFLQSIPYTFPWSTITKDGHIGYNNSIIQLVIFFTNHAPYSLAVTTTIKILLSLPLMLIYWRYRRNPPQEAIPTFTLEWAFALYLLAFLWLDVDTELTFGIVIYTYLLATLPNQNSKNLVRLVFLPYALTFLWLTISGIASFIVPLPALLVDPSLFIPFILIAMLGLYGLVLRQLNDILGKHAIQTVS